MQGLDGFSILVILFQEMELIQFRISLQYHQDALFDENGRWRFGGISFFVVDSLGKQISCNG